jgi:hypothetical protein
MCRVMSPAPDPAQTIVMTVDRGRAAMRGIWRLAVMLMVAAPTIIMAVNLNWKLLRLSDPASYYGLGVLWLALAATAGGLLVSAVRWLLLATWRDDLYVRLGGQKLEWSLGPFGKRVLPVQQIDVRLFPEIEADLLDRIPDDALTISMHHRTTGEDIGEKLEQFVRINAAQVWRFVHRQ